VDIKPAQPTIPGQILTPGWLDRFRGLFGGD